MDELLRDFGNFGFPVVVSAYLLFRLETKLERVAASIAELAVAVSTLRQESEARRDGGHSAN